MNLHGWKKNLAAVPGIVLSLLPKIACPACWPAYAGLLGSLGLGFLIPNQTYLLPLTAGFLLLDLGTLALRARRRHGYGPLMVGVAASCLILFGKFSLASNSLLYAGVSLLILAAAWNSWPINACGCASSWQRPETPAEVTAGEKHAALTRKRRVEVFVAGCGLCHDALALVWKVACGHCEVVVYDVRKEEAAARAKQLGIHHVPSVAINGRLAYCCSAVVPREDALRALGMGVPAF